MRRLEPVADRDDWCVALDARHEFRSSCAKLADWALRVNMAAVSDMRVYEAILRGLESVGADASFGGCVHSFQCAEREDVPTRLLR